MCPETQPVYLAISRPTQDGSYIQEYRSLVFRNLVNIEDKPLRISMQKLCNANKDAPIKFSVHSNMSGLEINSVKVPINDFVSGKLRHAAASQTTFSIDQFQIRVMPTFVDYLRSGWAISLVCAIDYTGSNGNPTSPSSLHYLGPNNQYENALGMVGSIVEPYDADRSFPVFGFGGIPRHMGINQTSHCFALNGNPGNPEICGIGQIIEIYRATQRQIELSGPTCFAPLLKEFLQYVSGLKAKNIQSYNIMLLLTDGIINDMP